MEREDYKEQILAVKNEILDEIRSVLGKNSKHDFKDTFYIHYVEGEVATTEMCTAVETDSNGMILFSVINSVLDNEKINSTSILMYDTESLLDILCNMKSEIRAENIKTLRSLLESCGGYADFDPQNWVFFCYDEGNHNDISHSMLKGLKIVDDKILVSTIWKEDGEQYDYFENCMPDDLIPLVISHLRRNQRKTLIGKLTEIVKSNKNHMDFDETFWYNPIPKEDEVYVEPAKLVSLHVGDDGCLKIGCNVKGSAFIDPTDVLSDEDLEKMVYYVEKSHIRRFTIRASAVFTRDFEVEANSYEDAVEKVKAELKANPWEEGDNNGTQFN